jgi:hypothetical protein
VSASWFRQSGVTRPTPSPHQGASQGRYANASRWAAIENVQVNIEYDRKEKEMELPASKQQLLDQLRHERSEWESLLARIGTHRLELAGVTDQWTMKDTIAHLTTWWRREVGRLAAVQRGERPADHPSQSNVAVINEWVYLTNRDRPIEHVLRDADETWQQFEVEIQQLREEVLFTEQFDWMEGRALGPGILDDFAAHLHEEHEPLIRAWLLRLESI